MPLSPAEYNDVCTLVRKQSAIELDADKSYLVEARLAPLARQEGFATLAELVAGIRNGQNVALKRKVVEALTTNETSFFRDIHPFDALRNNILPDLLAKRSQERRLNLWSAASSSGQEPFSIAILLREHFSALASWKVRIVATDLSTAMVERTKQGMYNQVEVNRGLAAPLLVKYFERKGFNWQVREDLRNMLECKQLNLIETWPLMPPLDIVFLRNVLIYFDVEAKRRILTKVKRVLRPDGYLLLGGAETTINLDDSFERVTFGKYSCYRVGH